MSYNISSSAFEQPLLKPLLEQLSQYFNSIQTKFYIIGATARDMIMDAHGEKSGRTTRDLDIAVAVSDWSKYQKIEAGLTNLPKFKKDISQKQRFIYDGIYHLDIVPFGNIMKEDDKIFWPPDEQMAMSVLGFSEVDSKTLEIEVDEHLKLNIASLAGIFLLKIVAWNDRNATGNKDADDLGFILRNYFTINENRIHELHSDLYDDTDFAIITAGAHLMGRDIAHILKDNPTAKQKIVDILNTELQKQEESKLINQILETNKIFKYEEVLMCINNINNELSNQSFLKLIS
jgi:predicted nucleotidyltransferase